MKGMKPFTLGSLPHSTEFYTRDDSVNESIKALYRGDDYADVFDAMLVALFASWRRCLQEYYLAQEKGIIALDLNQLTSLEDRALIDDLICELLISSIIYVMDGKEPKTLTGLALDMEARESARMHSQDKEVSDE